jgi:hypothetical protein
MKSYRYADRGVKMHAVNLSNKLHAITNKTNCAIAVSRMILLLYVDGYCLSNN